MSGNGRLETAINSLELALHEHTSDTEVMAAINAFRRIVKGKPLAEISREVYGGRYDGRTLPEYREEWQSKFESQAVEIQRLKRSETDLRKLLEQATSLRDAAVSKSLRFESKISEAEAARKAAIAAAKAFKRQAQPNQPHRQRRNPVEKTIWNTATEIQLQPKRGDPTHRPIKETTYSSRFEWTPEVYQHGLDLFIEKKRGLKGVYTELGLTEGTVCRKFYNNAPDETLLTEPIQVKSGERMSFLEFWKIGHAIYGEKWKARMEDRFKLARRVIGWNEPTFLSLKDSDALRREWRAQAQA